MLYMADFTIYQGTTHSYITIRPSDPFGPFVRSFTQGVLAEHEFVPRIRRVITTRKYSDYDVKTSRLYIPVEYTSYLVDHITSAGLTVDIVPIVPIEGRDIKLKINRKWKDKDYQTPAIEYLARDTAPRRGLQFQPGKGKTYCAIRAIVELGKTAIVIVPGLVEQWEHSFKEITNVGSKLNVIRGFKSILALTQCNFKPDILLCSIDTVRAYIKFEDNYQTLPYNFSQFLDHYGVGTKVMDEVHLNFHALTMIDLNANVKNNIYLTATFTSANRDTRKIFNVVFPDTMRYGAMDYERYVNVTIYRYYGEVLERKVIKAKGYSHARYEGEILKKESKFLRYMDEVIRPLIDSHYINLRNPGEKCLLFFSTLEMVHHVKKYLDRVYPKLIINEYIGGVDDDALDKVDIILTTPKSAGCGTDIKMLRTAINTISELSPTSVEQKRGRLRKLPNGVTPEYVDIFDGNIVRHCEHIKSRSLIHKNRCLSYKEYTI